ncbi:hypothetical protein J2Z35_002850 [Acetoanaerobium pronyense]|uniref:Restriction endonuclease type IV Mrr domain-containing protein n=1 Tax=Acetoanaerobium pronyense TaxID=1482736 RepID=A0ABS4KMK3_9FIRM|nr:hypothetical protein [Acetoanaerobium pronyense]MBP2029012.1 hypothetical protein [Acetoanaerobium pronyense]
MKISKMFNLEKTQYELDFVDINPSVDTPLFLDPYYISKCDFPFAIDAHSTLRSYFEFLLALLRGKRMQQAEELFSHLGETNDVCLGMSRGKPRGHGMGPEDTAAIFKELLQSRAIRSGIMEDIEDFRIFVPNIDKDKVSDMTANIIKKHLIEYTKEQCDLHGIPLVENVPSGMFWDPHTKSWDNQFTQRLVIEGFPILLVPKRIVSFTDKYTSTEYRQHFVLNYLQNEHLKLQTPLVKKYKSGEKYVTKKSVKDHEGVIDKEYLARFTEQHPEVFADFKAKTSKKITMIDGAVLDAINIEDVCNHLREKLSLIPSGAANATNYHNLIIGILELLFYPNLSSPKKEVDIHSGRKRIDITFNNSSETGFFFTLPNNNALLPCPFVFVECKNYTGEVANPELDQLSGRFSNRRGRVGILTCRSLDEDNAFMKRCADTFNDDRGLIIPITDKDLDLALARFPRYGTGGIEDILASKYKNIVFGIE